MTFSSEKEAGGFLYKAKDYQNAAPYLAKAYEQDPTDSETLLKLAVCSANNGQVEEAEMMAVRVLQLDPANHKAHTLLGAVLAMCGDHEAAEVHLERALAIAPNLPSAMWNKSHLELMRGDFKNGFEHFRYGRTAKINHCRAFGKEWEGEKTGTLFVWCEQGAGDVIQMLRYLPQIREKAERIALEVYSPLVSLCDVQGFADAVVAQPDDWHNPVQYDAHVGVMDLPRLCGVDAPEKVDGSPYLKLPGFDWSDKLQGRVLGICWKGSPTHENDAQRSLTEADLKPLAKFPFVSFQKGETLYDWPTVPMGDYAQTASLLAGLDLLVTCDTSVAHLAGALGVPTWCIVPKNGEWRWGNSGEKTCWYESVRVFRPDMEHGFTNVVAQIAKELDAWLSLAAKPLSTKTQ